MAELYMVRHGQASLGGEDYDQLSSIGERQSIRLGQFFAELGMRFDHVVLGSMRRHRQTLDGILAGMGVSIPGQELPGLDEYDFQSLYRATSARFPDLAIAAQGDRRAFYRGLKRVLQLWSAGELAGELPECWEDFQRRVAESRQFIQRNTSGKVLAITSGGVMGATLQQVLQAPAAAAIALNLQIHNTGVCRYFFNGEALSLASFNALPHLHLERDGDLITYG